MSATGSEPWVKDGIKSALAKWNAWWFMPVQTGMGEGGIHDFLACVPMVITQDMVGKKIGVFVSIEAKEQGMVDKLWHLDLKKAGLAKGAHKSKDGQFISNRPLQTHQYEGIVAASGASFICDDPVAVHGYMERVLSGRYYK